MKNLLTCLCIIFFFAIGCPVAVFAEAASGEPFTMRRQVVSSSTDSHSESDASAANFSADDFLTLVNRDNPLPADYRPDDLVRYKGTELREPARDAFVQMLAAMEGEGIYGLQLQSAYRCYAHQRSIFEDRIRIFTAKGSSREEAEALAAKSVQPPGASEHQLGLALDVSINGLLSPAFAQTEAGRWLEENCRKFGFVVRYPQGKTDITRIIYEPWHLRYVGIPHAQIMYENDITLEEYRYFLAQYFMYAVWGEDEYFLVQLSGDEIISTSKPIGASPQTPRTF